MASNNFAKVLQRNSWRLTTILVYAVLEWILIFLLLVSGIFQFIITKFASFFGLHPPCLWCSRLDHLIEPKEPDFYRKLICDRHAREIAMLGYCLAHKKLADSHGMCDECAFSSETHDALDAGEKSCCSNSINGEKKKNNSSSWVTCMSLVGMDFHDSNKKLLTNGDCDEAKWVSKDDFCSCCSAPLNEKLSAHSIFRSIFFNGTQPEGGMVRPAGSDWAALEFSGDFDDAQQRESADAHMKISEVFVGSSSSVSEDEESGAKLKEENEKIDLAQRKAEEELSDKDGLAESADDSEDDDDESYLPETEEESDSTEDESESCVSGDEDDLKEEKKKKSHEDDDKSSENLSDSASESDDDDSSDSSASSSSESESENDEEESVKDKKENNVEKSVGECSDGLEHLPDRSEVVEDRDVSMSVQSDMFSVKKMDDVVVVAKEFSSATNEIVSEIHAHEAMDAPASDVEEKRASTVVEVEAEPKDEQGVDSKTDNLNNSVQELSVKEEIQVPGDPEATQNIPQEHPADVIVAESAEVKDIRECKEQVNDEPIDRSDSTVADFADSNVKMSHEGECSSEKSDKHVTLETDVSIEATQLLNKRFVIDRKDSGSDSLDRRDSVVESLDGSILIDIDGEAAVERLKKALEAERKALSSVYLELEEERNAAAVAANETMAMITRLQEEKAAVQMEALQYQRMMEEQAEYDQEALQLLNEILVKREKEKQELEKELEMYRKKVIRSEARERRRENKRNDARDNDNGVSADSGDESAGCGLDQTSPENQSRTGRISSSSTLSDGTAFSDADDGPVDIEQNDLNSTPVEEVMSSSRIQENGSYKTSLDDSLTDFEQERLAIIEQLKVLEEKLHKLADDDQNVVSLLDSNGSPGHFDEEAAAAADNKEENVESGNENGVPSIPPTPRDRRLVAGVKGKRLLPLFEATNGEAESPNRSGQLSHADPSGEWRTVSMVVRDNARLAIEEEVYHVYERLQALEADREFLKHTIKSLRKGDEGMTLLQEIAQHLRDLRRVELKARSFEDDDL